jgi:hypothetical protein
LSFLISHLVIVFFVTSPLMILLFHLTKFTKTQYNMLFDGLHFLIFMLHYASVSSDLKNFITLSKQI